jgi:hypothetical protein
MLVCLIYSIFIGNFYRPFIYSHKINDYFFADVGNNISFIPGVYSINYLLKGKYIFSKFKDVFFYFIFLSLVEILSYFIPLTGTFDFKDIIGLFIGAVLLFIFLKKQ